MARAKRGTGTGMNTNLEYVVDFITGKRLKKTKEEPVRQKIERMLVEDYGFPKERMDIEFRIQRGVRRSNERADIVVFNDNKQKDQAHIYLVAEAEHPGIEFDNQVISYATATTAQFCIWSNGERMLFFYRDPQNPIAFEQIPEIPRNGETIKDIGRHLKDQLKPAHNLKMVFENIHNQLYGSANIRRPEELGREMTKILFCKIFDEKDPDPKCKFRATIEEIVSKTGKAAISTRIKDTFANVKQEYSDVFETDERIRLDDDSVSLVVSKLQHMAFMKTDSDIVGKSFEVFVPEELKGEKGEFFTPRPIVRMAVRMIAPSGVRKEKILDPACGSGGFLTVAMEEARSGIDKKYKKSHLSKNNIEKIKADYVGRYINGIDVERDLVSISKAYMAIIGDGRSRIFGADSLAHPDTWDPVMKALIKFGNFDVILTNPPFGSKIPIKKKDILQQYEFGKKIRVSKDKIAFQSDLRNSQVPDILFLERCVKFLKPQNGNERGGRMAIVLPRGILNNQSKTVDRAARDWLLRHAKILAVVDLPKDAFQPYTGTITSLVVLERTDVEPEEDYGIFMAISREIGHDKRGQPKYRVDDYGKPILDENGQMTINVDAYDIAKDYEKFLAGSLEDTSRSFVVARSQVRQKDRLDATAFNPKARKARSLLKEHLPEGWSMMKVKQLAKDVFYPGRFTRSYVEEEYGVPFIAGSNITRIKKVGVKYISTQTKNLEHYLVKEGWILVTRSGTSGIVTLADKSLDGLAVSEHVIRIVPDESKVDPNYLFAMLSNPVLTPILESGITGSLIDEITPEFLGDLKIPVPDDLEVQKKIGQHVFDAMQYISQAVNSFNDAESELNLYLGTT